MKFSTLLINLMISMSLCAQSFPKNEAGAYEFKELVEVPNTTKDALFQSASDWFHSVYGPKKQEKETIFTENGQTGLLVAYPELWAKVHYVGRNTIGGTISYNFIIMCYDEKYEYTINGFIHESSRSIFGSGGALENKKPDCGEEDMPLQVWTKIKSNCLIEINEIITEMKQEMSTSTE